jgi:hypothetical protein
MATASGSFSITSWDEQPYEEHGGGVKLTRASVTQAFTGDLEGEGAVQWLMYYREDGTASFVGLQRVAGTLAGRQGRFVVRDVGAFEGGVARGEWTIVDGSGADDLVGISGQGRFQAGEQATWSLDYDLG